MRIHELCKKYGVDKRQVDHWTRMGLIRTTGAEENGYRQYDEQSEEDLKRALVLDAMELNGQSLISWQNVMRCHDLPPQIYDMCEEKVRENMKRVAESYVNALEYIKEFKKRN